MCEKRHKAVTKLPRFVRSFACNSLIHDCNLVFNTNFAKLIDGHIFNFGCLFCIGSKWVLFEIFSGTEAVNVVRTAETNISWWLSSKWSLNPANIVDSALLDNFGLAPRTGPFTMKLAINFISVN